VNVNKWASARRCRSGPSGWNSTRTAFSEGAHTLKAEVLSSSTWVTSSARVCGVAGNDEFHHQDPQRARSGAPEPGETIEIGWLPRIAARLMRI
jgi:hypothetical protein